MSDVRAKTSGRHCDDTQVSLAVMRNLPRRRRSARVNKNLRRESAATGERRKNNFSSDWCGFLGERCPSHIKNYSYRRRDYSASSIQTTSMSPIVRLGEACDSARPPTSSTTTNNEGVFHPAPVHILHHKFYSRREHPDYAAHNGTEPKSEARVRDPRLRFWNGED